MSSPSAVDRLLPPIKVEEVFKRTKGKVVRITSPKKKVGGAYDVKTLEKSDKLLRAKTKRSSAVTAAKKGKLARSSAPLNRMSQSQLNRWKQRSEQAKRQKNSRHDGFKVAATLSSREKAVGIATGRAETVVKFDKAASGIKNAGHLQTACDYISRHGNLELIDQNGDLLDAEAARQRIAQWVTDQEIPADRVELTRPADARRCVISCPPGTDPEKLRAAAFQLGQEVFGEQGYEFVMTVHFRDQDHPKEPEHPHAHFLIKTVNAEGKRLNLRKADLRYLRERFAVIARENGIEMNATSRAVRGNPFKAKTQAQIHQEQRRIQTQAQKWAINRKKQQIKDSKLKQDALHPYEQQRHSEIVNALKTGRELPDHPVLVKAKKTRQKVMENISAAVAELRQGNAGDKALANELEKTAQRMPKVESAQQQKLHIARRKVAEKLAEQQRTKDQTKQKQSQAQKWAINRKKQKQQETNHER